MDEDGEIPENGEGEGDRLLKFDHLSTRAWPMMEKIDIVGIEL